MQNTMIGAARSGNGAAFENWADLPQRKRASFGALRRGTIVLGGLAVLLAGWLPGSAATVSTAIGRDDTVLAIEQVNPTVVNIATETIIEQRDWLTKGAISTEIRALARMGLVHRSTKLGDRKDYYTAESDFYTAIKSILKERQNSEFDRAVGSVKATLAAMDENWIDNEEWNFVYARVQALQEFFDAIDSLTKAVMKLDRLGLSNVTKILSVLK